MKQWLVKNNFWKALTALIIISILIVGASLFFIYDEMLIGPVYLGFAVLCWLLLRFFGINLKAVYGDIVFGMIDNGVLIFTTVLGGIYAGVAGAVLGGAAGNAITDGIGALFEGRIAQEIKTDSFDYQRSPMSTMLGKVIGCLFGAGIGLILVWTIKMIF